MQIITPEVEKTDTNQALVATSNIEEGKANLDRFGYTIHDNFLSAETLAALRERFDEQAELELDQGVATISSTGHAGADRYIGRTADGLPPISQQMSFLPNKGREFLDLIHHPVALAYAEHIFRNVPYNVVTQSGLILREGGRRQVLHADQQAVPFSTSIPVMLNVMTCLSDFEADMGATMIVPGSHRHSPPSMVLDPDEALAEIGGELVPMTAKAGSALIWESRTWHCQGDCTSPKTRSSIATVYGVHFIKPQDFYPAIIHDDVYPTLSEADREMLGFKVAFEYAGRIAPRHPGDPRSNTNARFPYIPELRRGGDRRAVHFENMATAHTDRLPETLG